MVKKENVILSIHSDSIPKSISEKIYNTIVKIKLNNGTNATGFFMKMKVNNKIMKCLFTCKHVISDNDIKNKLIMKIFYGKIGKEEERNIILDENIRFIRTFKNEDIILLEIIENDNILEDKYLEPDLNYENGFKTYENKNVYLAWYPRNSNFKERLISSGRITKIIDNKFEHILDSKFGSSGGPICNCNDDVIGIHTSENKMENINYGTFIGKIIDTLNNKSIINNNNNNNYIIGEIYVSINNINKDIRIINSFDHFKRENPHVIGDCINENEKELKQNCEIKINNILINFSYFYKFKKVENIE